MVNTVSLDHHIFFFTPGLDPIYWDIAIAIEENC